MLSTDVLKELMELVRHHVSVVVSVKAPVSLICNICSFGSLLSLSSRHDVKS